jgi:hypothetical protein
MLSRRLIRERVNPFAKANMLLANMPAGGALPRMNPTVRVTLIGICTVSTGKSAVRERKISAVILLPAGETDFLSASYAAGMLPMATAWFATDGVPATIAAIATGVGETAREIIFSPDPPDGPACGKCPLAARSEICASALAAAPSGLSNGVAAASAARCHGVKSPGFSAFEDVIRGNEARIGLWRAVVALKMVAPRFKGTARTVATGIRGDRVGRAEALAGAPRVSISARRS